MSENNQEESYSMYPNTSSPPPPPHANLHFPVYQNPVPMYGYPQANPYMYAAAQTPNYHFKMMNQSQGMSYQNNSGIPQQNNGGMKKKWNSNNSSSGSSHTMNPSKSQSYYPNQNYYTNVLMNSANNQSMNSMQHTSNKSNSATASYDPFKFDSSKVKIPKDIDLTKDLPIFFNTSAEEFAEARSRTYELKLKSTNRSQIISDMGEENVASLPGDKHVTKVSTKIPKNGESKIQSKNEASTERKSEIETKSATLIKEIIKEEKNEITSKSTVPEGSVKSKTSEVIKKVSEAKSKDDVNTTTTSTAKMHAPEPVKSTSTEQEKVSSSTESPTLLKANEESKSSTPATTATNTPVTSSSPETKQPTRSWSSIASSAVPKGKPVTIGKPVISRTSTPTQAANTQPQKKNKKYIPPSTKGSEPLGILALRMCFDPDFVNYTLKHAEEEGQKLPINSIIPRGIVNNANICFMSSVLQVLLYCKPFVDLLNVLSTRNMNSRVGSSSSKLIDACISLYGQFDRETFEEEKKNNVTEIDKESIKKGRQEYATVADSIRPDDFYQILSKIPKFSALQWGHQEDAEEFLTQFLDQLHEELISSIDCLSENEIQNILQSINDENLKIFFIRNLVRYKDADFIVNISSQLKDIISKYGNINDDENNDDEGGWHEVSSTSKKGKKTKTAAKRTVETSPSPISNIFSGQFRSVLDTPNNKESQSITLDPFQTIQLDISDPNINDLESAFKKFSEFELVPFKSSNGHDIEAKKQTFIDKLPEVLLVQLKRFSFISNTEEDKTMANYNAYSGRIEKIRKKINYSHNLVIPSESVSAHALKYDVSGRQYKLSGVIYHHGLSPDGGHYTADIHHQESDKWYRIDDVNITELKQDDVLISDDKGVGARTAYILLYQKI